MPDHRMHKHNEKEAMMTEWYVKDVDDDDEK